MTDAVVTAALFQCSFLLTDLKHRLRRSSC